VCDNTQLNLTINAKKKKSNLKAEEAGDKEPESKKVQGEIKRRGGLKTESTPQLCWYRDALFFLC